MRTTIRVWTVLAAGLLLLGTAPAAHAAVTVSIGSGSGAVGETVDITVSMASGGDSVAGVQNDIVFDPSLVDLAKSSSCKINPDIGDRLVACDDDPQTAPCKQLQRNLADCPGAAGCPAGSDGMRRFRGIILSTANVNSIPDGVLYTCTFTVISDAARSALLQNLNGGASDASGTALTTDVADGQIQINGGGGDTPTPSETATPVPTPTVPAGGAGVRVGSASGEPGSTVTVDVTLETSGAAVAGVQNDIIFDPALVDLAKSSSCKINPAIGDRLVACDDDPQTAPCKQLQRNLADCPAAAGCPAGSEGMRRFRGIILSTANVNTIPDGVLYTCTFTVTGAAGTAALQNLNFGSSDGSGSALETVGGDGQVVIGPAPTTPPASETPTPTATETIVEPTATNTPVPPTATNTPVPPTSTMTPGKKKKNDDGCAVVAPAGNGFGWLLLIPAGLFWVRRRRGF